MAHAHSLPKTVAKPEFADYTVAGSDEGRHSATLLAIAYDAQRAYIRARRLLRLDNRFWDTRLKSHPVKIRGGFPTKREIDYSLPSKKGQPKALNQFKRKSIVLVGAPFYRIKIFQLHPTRGWKAFA